MTDQEKLDLILSEVLGIKQNMQEMKQDMQNMKQDMQNMKQDIADLQEKTTGIALHIENCTDKNIQLIAENFIELTKKLNQAIPASDKNLAYEVKVNYLIEEVTLLKKEVAILKEKIA